MKPLLVTISAAVFGVGLAFTAAPASAVPFGPGTMTKADSNLVEVRTKKRVVRTSRARLPGYLRSDRVDRVSANGNVEMANRPVNEANGGQLPGGPRRLNKRN